MIFKQIWTKLRIAAKCIQQKGKDDGKQYHTTNSNILVIYRTHL